MDTLPLVSPEQVGLSAARLARLSGWMKGWVDSGKLPGLLVAVMRRGELAFAETYGKADVERNKPKFARCSQVRMHCVRQQRNSDASDRNNCEQRHLEARVKQAAWTRSLQT